MSFSDELVLAALLHIKNGDDSMRRHDNIVAGSLIGRRVRLAFADPAQRPLACGAEGWVRSVLDNGDVTVEWDHGEGRFWLVPGADRWEWLGATRPTVRYPDGLVLEALLRIKSSLTSGDKSTRSLDKKVAESLSGRRLRLVFINDEYTDLEPGDEGWVRSVDGAGTVSVRWDRVVGTALIPGSDQWEWL